MFIPIWVISILTVFLVFLLYTVIHRTKKMTTEKLVLGKDKQLSQLLDASIWIHNNDTVPYGSMESSFIIRHIYHQLKYNKRIDGDQLREIILQYKPLRDGNKKTPPRHITWNDLSDLGIIERINREICHPLGLAILKDDKGISVGSLVTEVDGFFEYPKEHKTKILPDDVVRRKITELKVALHAGLVL